MRTIELLKAESERKKNNNVKNVKEKIYRRYFRSNSSEWERIGEEFFLQLLDSGHFQCQTFQL